MKNCLRVFVGVGLFLLVGKPAEVYGQGLIENPPYLICEPQKEVGKMCLSHTYIDGVLGNRIPVILVHGWDPKNVPGRPDRLVWHSLTSYLQSKSWFRERHKFYTLTYSSNIPNLTIREIGLIFRDLLDRMDRADPDFHDKLLVMIGHSMGGLVARSFMKEFRRGLPGRGGDRVIRLITLGTPHHGSPLANGPARDKKAGGIWAVALRELVEDWYYGGRVRWYMDNRYDLHWDNYDGFFGDDYNEKSIWIDWLNSGDTFEEKIVAYGGVLWPLDKLNECWSLSLTCLATLINNALGISRSDGYVPLDSALFYPCTDCIGTRIWPGYNHSEIARGKFQIFGDPEPLFESIAEDLLSVIVPVRSGFDNYADLGNLADEQFHNLQGWGEVNPGLLPYPDTDRTSRYQRWLGSNSVYLFVSQPMVPYQLTFRSEDGHCDDSFSVGVNGRGVYSYSHRGPLTDFPIHTARVPAEAVSSSRVRVTFWNLSRENCGLAAIYYIRLDPL